MGLIKCTAFANTDDLFVCDDIPGAVGAVGLVFCLAVAESDAGDLDGC
ncbi:MAG: hypothetical protein ACR2IE_20240 [Candidatus Sumerlaeaceae bacterium]